MAKRKRTTNDLHNITHKTKDRVTRTSIKTGGELRCSERVDSSCATSGIRRVTLTSGDLGHNPKYISVSTTYEYDHAHDDSSYEYIMMNGVVGVTPLNMGTSRKGCMGK
jgi:hypothetical protein